MGADRKTVTEVATQRDEEVGFRAVIVENVVTCFAW